MWTRERRVRASVNFSMTCPHSPEDAARSEGCVLIVTARRRDGRRYSLGAPLGETKDLARAGAHRRGIRYTSGLDLPLIATDVDPNRRPGSGSGATGRMQGWRLSAGSARSRRVSPPSSPRTERSEGPGSIFQPSRRARTAGLGPGSQAGATNGGSARNSVRSERTLLYVRPAGRRGPCPSPPEWTAPGSRGRPRSRSRCASGRRG